MRVSPELRAPLKEVRRNGWVVRVAKNGHITVRKGNHRVTLAASPSDVNAWKNALKELRKAGAL